MTTQHPDSREVERATAASRTTPPHIGGGYIKYTTTFAKFRHGVKYQRQTNMATDVQVQCINKRDRYNHYERIQNIGGVNGDGTRWKLDEDRAIAGMKAGTWTFYTYVNFQRANVRIGHHLGREYLTTEPDGQQPNNLLALPECP